MNAEERLMQSIGIPLRADFVDVENKKIYFVKAGSGPVVVLLHGANIGWGMWYKIIPELAKDNTIIALDMPGCGRSFSINWNQVDLQKDVLQTLEQFFLKANLGSVSLVGHSFGGWAAVRLKQTFPDKIKKVVLFDPVGIGRKLPFKQFPLSVKPFVNFLTKVAVKPTYKNLVAFIKDGLYQKDSISEVFLDYYTSFVGQNKGSHPLLFMSSLVAGGRLKEELDVAGQIKNIKNDILIAWGERDPILPWKNAESVAKLNTFVDRCALFDGSGHVPPIEEFVRCAQFIKSFISL